ncbi:MAG: metallophosphoesterase [Lewinellaceae bacterium]|nr:metallophosphoesterase [Phaeodactylibacter sp.]MCB9036340.1 metallophosphoesterase [Lewinellaceae bacterium]
MKKTQKLLLKTLKWTSGGLLVCYFFIILAFGLRDSDGNISIRYLKLPGWEALNRSIHTELDGIDGPYLFGQSLYQVDEYDRVMKKHICPGDSLLVTVNNEEKDAFYARLKSEYEVEESVYPQPSKLIVISDIEGNFNAFYSFLVCNKVIDANYNWTFGDGHLVLLGDFVDRGEDVAQVLWLAYSLEEKAEEHCGKVHFILGNHEILNIEGHPKFVDEKYIKVAQEISGEENWEKALRFLFSETSELGKWLRTKNAVEMIGGYLFAHAGLSPDIVGLCLSLTEINDIIRENIGKDLYHHPGDDETANFMLGQTSPLWYRGLTAKYKYYNKASESELDEILDYFQAEKVIVGHVVVREITADYAGKLINIDLKHGKDKCSGNTKGLLIQGREVFKIDDLGNQEALFALHSYLHLREQDRSH